MTCFAIDFPGENNNDLKSRGRAFNDLVGGFGGAIRGLKAGIKLIILLRSSNKLDSGVTVSPRKH